MVVSEPRCAIKDQKPAKLPGLDAEHEITDIKTEKDLKAWIKKHTNGSQPVCSYNHSALLP
jgi:hypothetical protein